jgi:hypothetical protein
MSDTEKSKPETTDEQRESEIADEMEAEMEERDEARQAGERSELEDLNVGGLQTGTYDSPHRGVHWGPSYRVRRKAAKPSQGPNDTKTGS